MTFSDFIDYQYSMTKEPKLTVWHGALLTALFLLAVRQKRFIGIRVSRSRIMTLAHIRTLPTYHKYFRELQEWGIIVYRPSYHPGVKSEVDIKKTPYQ